MPSIKSLPSVRRGADSRKRCGSRRLSDRHSGANDPALLGAALGDIARARGMSEIAKASRLTISDEHETNPRLRIAIG